jgi:DNA polymerase elongation subunit (family B)
MVKPLPWPAWQPVPPDWNREFFFIGADYEYDSIAERTLFRIQGVTREDNSVLLELYGHHPRCYFKSPGGFEEARALVAEWEVRAKTTGYAYFGSSQKWVYEQFADARKWVLNATPVRCEDLIEDRPAERVGVFCMIEFAHPALVKMFREYVLYCYGNESEPRVPSWCIDERSKSLFARSLVYEANVDYVERVIADRQLPPSVWYKISHYDKGRRAVTLPSEEYDVTDKRYDLVLRANIAHVKPTGDRTPFPLRILAYDIEAENEDGDHMPRAADNAVLDVVVYAYRDGQKDKAVSFAFELGSCDRVTDHMFVYQDDAELLRQFRKFAILSRCDAISAHNGNGFDLPYMIKRAKALGIHGWDYLGPLKRRARIQVTENKAFKKHNAYVPGLLVLDTMRIEQETLNARAVGLSDCALRYLDDLVKMDVFPDEISRLQETHAGRSKKHKYCARDAELVMEIEQAQRGVEAALDVSRRCIPMQTVLNRSLGAKGEGFIARSAMSGSRPQIMLVLSFMRRFMRGRPEVRVRGGYHGPKEYEGALNLEPVPLYVAPSSGPRRQVVFTFDFSGLYPSIMRWRNISPDTELRSDTIQLMSYREGRDYWASPDYVEESGRRRVVRVADNPKFLASNVRRGILPKIQDGLADDRKAVKADLAVAKAEQRRTDLTPERARELRRRVAQLSLQERTIKLLMNGIYGLMGRIKAKDAENLTGMIHSVRYVSSAVASTITREGRGLILQSKDIVHDNFPGASVVGGDTDSVFVLVETGDDAEAYALGKKMEDELNSHFEHPIHIGLENMAIAFEQYRKKNYKKLVQAPLGDGTWSKPELITKGESWIKRNFPRNLKRACRAIADVVLTAEPCDDRLDRVLAVIREERDRIAEYDVPIGDLMESSKLARPLKDYKPPLTKGVAMLKRKYEADLAAAKRKRDEEASTAAAASSAPGARRRKKRRTDASLDVYQPETGTIASFVIAARDDALKSRKVTDRSIPGLVAIRDNARYDVDYYVQQLFSTAASSFGQAVATLSGESDAVEAAVQKKKREFDERIIALRDKPFHKEKELARLERLADPRNMDEERFKGGQNARKVEYLRVMKDLVGAKRGPDRRDNSGILRFFKRTRAGDLEEQCDRKREEIDGLLEKKREAWARCAECVGDRAEEAERCRSYRNCPNFSLRSHLDFKIQWARREVVDIEDLILNQ